MPWDFPLDWLFLEALRRIPRFFPADWVGWATFVSSTFLGVTNLLFRRESIRSRRETALLRQDVRELLTKPLAMAQFIPAANFTKGRLVWSPKFVVVHWTAGTLDDTVRYFQRKTTQASAHLVIKDSVVVQMVKFDDTAWHAGNWLANLQSIGIEHEGGPSLPISNETYQTSAKIIAEIHKRYGWGEPTAATIRPHKAFRATQCPGNLDLERLVFLSREAYHPKVVHVPVQADFEPQKPEPGDIPAIHASVETMPKWGPFVQYSPVHVVTITSKKGVNVRTTPEVRPDNLFTFQRLGKNVTAFPKGATFYAKGKVYGEPVSGGSNVWILTEGGRYVWSGATDHK